MRRRTTRDEWIGGSCSNGRITVEELAVMYGLALLVPVILWAVTNPLLAAGAGALAVGVYMLARIGARTVRESVSNETDGTGGASGRAVD